MGDRGGLWLTVEHLALVAEAVALGDEVVDLLATLQHAFDSLVQDDFSFVQLLLDLHNAVGLMRVLVLGEVFLQLRHRDAVVAGRKPRRPRVRRQELVHHLREQLVCH